MQATTDHQGNHLITIQFGLGAGSDVSSIAENRHTVRDGIDFIQSMTDVDDSDSLGTQFPNHPEQAIDLPGGEGCCGLVHHKDAGIL